MDGWTTNLLAIAERNLRYVGYAYVSSLVILTYDYVLTFGDEVSLMWPSPWTFPKIVFFLTRYLPFLDIPLVIWQITTSQTSRESCALVFKASSWMLSIGIIGAEVILAVRTWALDDFSRKTGIFFSICGCLTIIPFLVLRGITVQSLQYIPLPSNMPGCLLIPAGKTYMTWTWMLLAIFEFAVLTFMLIKAVRVCRIQGHTRISRKVYTDGSLFYVYLFALSIINLIVAIKPPLGIANLLSSIQRVIHSVMTGRILIDLRRLGTNNWQDEFRADYMIDTVTTPQRSDGSREA